MIDARSRLTEELEVREARFVKRRVSGERPTVKEVGLSSVAVRQTPLTAIEQLESRKGGKKKERERDVCVCVSERERDCWLFVKLLFCFLLALFVQLFGLVLSIKVFGIFGVFSQEVSIASRRVFLNSFQCSGRLFISAHTG
jgi:hypothetical protein